MSAGPSSRASISVRRWQAAVWRGSAVGASVGSVSLQTSMRIGQRGTNGHPEGRPTSDGGLPSSGVSGSRSVASSRGSEPSSPSV